MVDVKWSGSFKPDLCICNESDKDEKSLTVLSFNGNPSENEVRFAVPLPE
jgi:hypothetical protein